MSAPRLAVDLRALVGRPSGIGYFTLALLERLALRGNVVCVGMAHDWPHAADRLRAAGIELEKHRAPLGVWWQQLRVPRRLRSRDIDLFWSPLFTLPLALPVPGIVTVHDLTAVLYPETHRLKVKLSILPLLRPSLDRARHVIADSRATAADIRSQFPESAGKVRVVYPGVDPEFVPGEEEAIAATRRDLACPEGYVLFVGTIEPRKNIGVLLDAWEALRQSDSSSLPLVLAGSYGWRSRHIVTRIESLVARGGVVWIEGPDRQRVVRLIQAARALVLPSLYEGFGLPAAESMSCAVPTVVSACSSLPEVVGDGGLTFEADDAEGLAHLLTRITREPSWAAELGARGHEASSRFDWDRSAAEMEQIFLDSLG